MFFEKHEPVDADLLFMLRRCRHVQDLCVQARLSADTVIDVMNLQHQRRLGELRYCKSVIDVFTFYFPV